MAFDLSAISAWTDEKARPFITKSIIDSKTNSMLNPYPGLKTTTKVPSIDLDYDILQAGSCTFNASGDLVFDQRTLDPKQIDVEMEFCIKDLEPYFFAQTLPAGSFYDGLEPEQALFLDTIRTRIAEAMELAAWAGEEGGASGAASLNLYDGIHHIVENEVAGGGIPAAQDLGTTALSTSNTVGVFEAMRDALPAGVYDRVEDESNWVFLCSGQTKQKYNINYRNDYGANTNNFDFNRTFVDGTRLEIVSCPGLTALDASGDARGEFILLTRKDNWWYGFDVEEAESLRVGTDQYDKNVWVQASFKIAYNTAKPEDLVVKNV